MSTPLRVEVDAGSGFCFGVTRAISAAERSLAEGAAPLYCLGDIVHNGSECSRLATLGLVTISHDQLPSLAGRRVLLRAHGEPPSTYDQAHALGIQLIDATCPVVLRLQQRIRQEWSRPERPHIVIYGQRGHAEVLGLVGQTEGEATVIETPAEAAQLTLDRPVSLFSQTTKPLEQYRLVVESLQQRMPAGLEFRWFDTVCRQVAGRLPAVSQFAAGHDVVVFVSGQKSSNGRVLYEACRASCARAYMVDSPLALRVEWFRGASSVGVCGATSTPRWLMEDCKRRILELSAAVEEEE